MHEALQAIQVGSQFEVSNRTRIPTEQKNVYLVKRMMSTLVRSGSFCRDSGTVLNLSTSEANRASA